MRKLFAFTFIMISFLSCQKKEEGGSFHLPNYIFLFQIVKDGSTLPDSSLNGLKLFYFDQGVKKYRSSNSGNAIDSHIVLPSVISGDTYYDELGVRMSLDVNSFGVYSNYWYFEFANGDIDTLYVESKYLDNAEGMKDPCRCNNPFTVIRYNGVEATINEEISDPNNNPIYQLIKQ